MPYTTKQWQDFLNCYESGLEYEEALARRETIDCHETRVAWHRFGRD